MSEIKVVFGQLLDVAAPPLPPVDAVLIRVRRAARRRNALRAAVGAAVGITVVGLTAVAALGGVAAYRMPGGDRVGGAGPTASSRTPGPAVSPAPSTSPVPDPPMIGGSKSDPGYERAAALYRVLLSVVPAGYSTPDTDLARVPDGNAYVRGVQATERDPVVGMEYYAGFDVYRDGRGGALSVHLAPRSGPAPTGDLCQQTVVHQGTDENCQVLKTADGTRVRVSWRSISGHGRIYYATRYYDDAEVMVQQSQTCILWPSYQILASPVFSEAALAEVAAKPEFNVLSSKDSPKAR
ncbi:hypothetical protein [Planosporangium mesophilum]|uniref:Uncharacterized protein n=1 Tax=Planosporangium mesophilum TaxID=689768 RepID=A0A8J3TDS3_9ACTN|nr:hypothetical protein [Planosporangium mesophilum]NJC81951.1 hypothetical protein [Planosporangium mesophilum]GII25285.1 hypothetical protein Pme01_48820 [Planosporangium mesophilum]